MLTRPETHDTPLGQLRALTEKIDSRVGGLEKASPTDAVALLDQLDQAETLYAVLAEASVDLRAEDGRRETIRLTLQRKAGKMLGLLQAKGGLAALRAPLNPAHEHWWWYLDEYVAEQRRKDRRHLLKVAVVIAILLAIAAVLGQTVLRPDPLVVAHMGVLQKIQQRIQDNDPDGALQATDKGLAEFPNDGEILLWRGAVLALMKRDKEAQEAFAAARPQFLTDSEFLTQRASIRQQAGDFDGAYADADAAVNAAPDSAQAYLMLGGAQEMRGNVGAAIQAYQIAADLASNRKNGQMEALAKIRLATLMERGPGPPPLEATPRATP